MQNEQCKDEWPEYRKNGFKTLASISGIRDHIFHWSDDEGYHGFSFENLDPCCEWDYLKELLRVAETGRINEEISYELFAYEEETCGLFFVNYPKTPHYKPLDVEIVTTGDIGREQLVQIVRQFTLCLRVKPENGQVRLEKKEPSKPYVLEEGSVIVRQMSSCSDDMFSRIIHYFLILLITDSMVLHVG